MNSIWNISIDDYLAIVKWAKEDGLQAGQSMEKYLFAYAKAKGIKPVGHTELTNDELIGEYVSHGKKILDMKVNNDGKTEYKIVKPKEDEL